jgi:metal-sulfur cluster biosynthetic enzyme
MNEKALSPLQEAVISRLQEVIDPETNVDVMRMRLIENLTVDREGKVCYTFRPSSPLCPLAVSLVTRIKKAVAEVPGVTDQEILIEGYIAAEELTKLINKEN